MDYSFALQILVSMMALAVQIVSTLKQWGMKRYNGKFWLIYIYACNPTCIPCYKNTRRRLASNVTFFELEENTMG